VETTSGRSPAAAKRDLRARVLARRAALPPHELELAAAEISARLRELPALRAARIVAAYISIGSEVPTGELISDLLATGRTVLLPRLEADRSLTWRPLTTRSDLVAGRHGLLEPSQDVAARPLYDADVVVLPGLSYDGAGNRLGRGGGSYDRALKDLPGTVTAIGITLDGDLVDAIPVESHDRPVQIIVTPSRVITVDGGGT
jgi:5-formyltetrahydrofolate cyclo-ligase